MTDSDLLSYRQFWGETKKKAHKLAEYGSMTKRPYANPPGYTRFDLVAERLSTQIYALFQMWNGERLGFAEQIAWTLSTYIAQLKAPIYWMQRDLLQALMHTRMPKSVGHLARPMPCAVIMLPIGLVQTPDQESVDFIGFYHFVGGEKLPDIVIPRNGKVVVPSAPQGDRLWVFTVTNGGTMYASSSDLKVEDGCLELDQGTWRPSPIEEVEILRENPVEVEQAFLRTIESLALQTILLMQSRPDLIDGDATARSFKGVSNTKKLLPRQPRWVGRDYKIRTKGPGTGHHASPESHWRQGHERRVVVGKGRLERRWRWFEPVLVNAGKEKPT